MNKFSFRRKQYPRKSSLYYLQYHLLTLCNWFFARSCKSIFYSCMPIINRYYILRQIVTLLNYTSPWLEIANIRKSIQFKLISCRVAHCAFVVTTIIFHIVYLVSGNGGKYIYLGSQIYNEQPLTQFHIRCFAHIFFNFSFIILSGKYWVCQLCSCLISVVFVCWSLLNGTWICGSSSRAQDCGVQRL